MNSHSSEKLRTSITLNHNAHKTFGTTQKRTRNCHMFNRSERNSRPKDCFQLQKLVHSRAKENKNNTPQKKRRGVKCDSDVDMSKQTAFIRYN